MTDYVHINTTKPEFFTYIIVMTLNSLVFLFLTFVLYKVNKTQENSHKCNINLMIICLLLTVLCKFSSLNLYIFNLF